MVIAHGASDRNAEGGKGIHGYLGFADVVDEAARAVVAAAQVATDLSRVIRQTGGIWAGDYVADGAGDWKAMGPSDDKVMTAPQITSNEDAFNPAGWTNHPTKVFIDLSADWDMEGMVPARGERTIINTNASFRLRFPHEQGGGDVENRIIVPDGGVVDIREHGAATVWYDYSVSKWRLINATEQGGL